MTAWNHRDVTDEHVFAYVEPSTASPKIAQALKTLPVKRNIAKLLANAECFFDSFMKLLSCCWGADRTIRSSEWQLIVLRTAASLDAPYEWDVNEPLARLLSFDTDEKVDFVRAGNLSNQSFFTNRHRFINEMMYQLVQNDTVDKHTVLEEKKIFGDAGVVEIIIIHGIYALLAKLMRNAIIDFDPRIPDLKATLKNFNAPEIEQKKSYRSETM